MSDQHRTEESDKENESRPRKRTAPWFLGGLVVLLLFTLVALQAFGVWTVLPPDATSDTLLIYALSSLNFAAFVVFTFILVRSLVKLRRERRERQLGSKLKTRLVVSFISLSLLPITAMALFSYLFFNRTLEKWFYSGPEEIIKQATLVEREAIANQSRNLRETAQMLGSLIDEQPEADRDQTLTRLVGSGNLAAIEIIDEQGNVVAGSQAEFSADARTELSSVLEAARSGHIPESLSDGKGFDVATVPLSGNRRLIVAPKRFSSSTLGDTIIGSQSKYNDLVAKQRKVRLLGLSTLGLMTLLLLFAATWIAIHLARGIAKPIQALAEASKEIARGNLDHRVTTIADDELALLASSFNQMITQLAENRSKIEAGAAELRDKNLALEDRRHYIETVLESLSTGVISLDEHDRVTTINASAVEILKLREPPQASTALAEIVSSEDLTLLERLLRRARRAGHAAEQTQLGLTAAAETATVPVALTATALRASSGEERGVVLVIEDLSELLSAQRAAAWSEVARRMAHEIKNPLTPIQLSAERIAKNFRRETIAQGGNGAREDRALDRERVAEVVDECTATITREVAGLKAMVDEFSRFARLPHARLESADLNEVVTQAVALYRDRLNGTRLDVRLGQRLALTMLDPEQMRRVFVNLIDNALEALAGVEGEHRITVATAHDPRRGVVMAEVTDTGHGIPRSDFGRLFQPNFSTRERGTGLGLAIVQRIITDHGGRIRVSGNHPRGAKFTIELAAA
ncbi:MAG: two-component system, NtrC family, nitrogen regulation sensor histidine kinase NtrY [Acidobacteriota bacterium]|jgi:nitrogen fixation/metabolism regulation signal transduction histidine kinase|nr:two-component system, NtrC family, nitrogen regulation sensor histidine kinase NtrY [Acidobacteriota bacterium]